MKHPIVAELAAAGITVRRKDESRLMCLLGFILGKWFMRSAWTTIGPKTIWAPTLAAVDKLGFYEHIIRHEMVHAAQARRLPVLWQLAYLFPLLPLPCAYWRWRSEREAYMVNLRAGTHTVEQVVDTLWHRYGWCWPKPWMRKWFAKELTK